MRLMFLFAALAATLSAAPAAAQSQGDAARYLRTVEAAEKTERVYLALSAVDLIQTLNFPDGVVESNPLFSKHPRPARIIAAKVAAGAIHYTAFRLALREHPRFALRMAQVSVGIQGGIVGMNMRFTFR